MARRIRRQPPLPSPSGPEARDRTLAENDGDASQTRHPVDSGAPCAQDGRAASDGHRAGAQCSDVRADRRVESAGVPAALGAWPHGPPRRQAVLDGSHESKVSDHRHIHRDPTRRQAQARRRGARRLRAPGRPRVPRPRRLCEGARPAAGSPRLRPLRRRPRAGQGVLRHGLCPGTRVLGRGTHAPRRLPAGPPRDHLRPPPQRRQAPRHRSRRRRPVRAQGLPEQGQRLRPAHEDVDRGRGGLHALHPGAGRPGVGGAVDHPGPGRAAGVAAAEPGRRRGRHHARRLRPAQHHPAPDRAPRAGHDRLGERDHLAPARGRRPDRGDVRIPAGTPAGGHPVAGGDAAGVLRRRGPAVPDPRLRLLPRMGRVQDHVPAPGRPRARARPGAEVRAVRPGGAVLPVVFQAQERGGAADRGHPVGGGRRVAVVRVCAH